jgi:hypothetical protein
LAKGNGMSERKEIEKSLALKRDFKVKKDKEKSHRVWENKVSRRDIVVQTRRRNVRQQNCAGYNVGNCGG